MRVVRYPPLRGHASMLLLCFQWHASADCGSFARGRLDGEVAANKLHSLTHADEAQSATVHRFLLVEASSSITYGKLNLSRSSAQLHFEVPHTTMFHCVL